MNRSIRASALLAAIGPLMLLMVMPSPTDGTAAATMAQPRAGVTTPITDISWSSRAPLKNNGRAESASVWANGRFWVISGFSSQNPPVYLDTVLSYDPANDAWATMPTRVPQPLTHTAAEVVDDRWVYLAGGYSPDVSRVCSGGVPCQFWATTNVWRYDTWTDTWSAAPGLPKARAGGGLVLIGRTLWFIAGSDSGRHDHTEVWSLNVDTGTAWQAEAPLPAAQARTHVGAVGVGTSIIVVGGQQGVDSAATFLQSNFKFDTANPAAGWTRIADIPQYRSHLMHATVVFACQIVVAGGDIPGYKGTSTVYVYNPATDTWSLMPTPLPRATYAHEIVTDGSSLYFTGGAPLNLSRTSFVGTAWSNGTQLP